MSAELERLAAACLFPSFPGETPPDWIRRRAAQGAGGVVLFSSNVRDGAQAAALTAALREERPDLLVAIDEEGGDVTRLEARTGSSYPGNAALGAIDDPALTERVARSIGAELAAAGIDLDLAPVADLAVDPASPVIGVRSFGADPELVARHVAASVRGLQSVGVAACAKHFPGHGATDRDSHLELPTLAGDPAAGLEPFRAAIRAGVRSIMTAHVRVPGFGEEPATVEPAVVDGLLRGELGFEGTVIADALEMRGLAGSVGIEEGAVRALLAGVDALLLGRDLGDDAFRRVHRALLRAVEAGRLPEERLAEAAARVARLAAWTSPDPAAAPDRAAGAEAARRALESDGDVGLAGPALVVELRGPVSPASDEPRHSLGEILAGRLPGTEVVRDAAEAAARAEGRELVVVVSDAHRHAWMREAAARLLAGGGAVVVDTGLPVWRPEGARGYLATRGSSRASLEAAAALLLAPAPAGRSA